MFRGDQGHGAVDREAARRPGDRAQDRELASVRLPREAMRAGRLVAPFQVAAGIERPAVIVGGERRRRALEQGEDLLRHVAEQDRDAQVVMVVERLVEPRVPYRQDGAPGRRRVMAGIGDAEREIGRVAPGDQAHAPLFARPPGVDGLDRPGRAVGDHVGDAERARSVLAVDGPGEDRPEVVAGNVGMADGQAVDELPSDRGQHARRDLPDRPGAGMAGRATPQARRVYRHRGRCRPRRGRPGRRRRCR